MCIINFTIDWEDLDSGLIFNQEGQYRKSGNSIWTPFAFNLSDPQTPYLTEIGDYEMRLRIFDGRSWSDWFYTYFTIGCGAFTIGFSTGFDA